MLQADLLVLEDLLPPDISKTEKTFLTRLLLQSGQLGRAFSLALLTSTSKVFPQELHLNSKMGIPFPHQGRYLSGLTGSLPTSILK